MFCFACYLHFDFMSSKGHDVTPATTIVVTTCQFVVNARADATEMILHSVRLSISKLWLCSVKYYSLVEFSLRGKAQMSDKVMVAFHSLSI